MSNLPNIEELRKSFNRVYDGADQLQREYDIVREAQQLNIPVDIYCRLYQLRKEQKSPAYPEQKDWLRAIPEWTKWFFITPRFGSGQSTAKASLQTGFIPFSLLKERNIHGKRQRNEEGYALRTP